MAHTKVFCRQMSAICTRAQANTFESVISTGGHCYSGPVVVNRRVPVRQAHCSDCVQIFLKRAYAASSNDISEEDRDTPFYWGMRIYNAMQTTATSSDMINQHSPCRLYDVGDNIDTITNTNSEPETLANHIEPDPSQKPDMGSTVTFGDRGHDGCTDVRMY